MNQNKLVFILDWDFFQQQGKCEIRKGKNGDRYRRDDDPETDDQENGYLDDIAETEVATTETERSNNWISPVLVSFL